MAKKIKHSDKEWYKWTKDIILPALIFIFGAIITIYLSTTQKEHSEEINKLKISDNITNLRVPGKWKDAGFELLRLYLHDKDSIMNSLFENIIPDSAIHGQMRNEPILWVFLLITDNYGKPKFNSNQIAKLNSLKNSKEYIENPNFKNYLDRLLE